MEQKNNSQSVSKFFKKEDIDFLKRLNEYTDDLNNLLNDSQSIEKFDSTNGYDIKKEKVK